MVKLGAAVLFSTLGMETVTVLIAVAGLAVLLLASFSSSVPLAVVGGVVRDRFTFELAYTGMAIEGVEADGLVVSRNSFHDSLVNVAVARVDFCIVESGRIYSCAYYREVFPFFGSICFCAVGILQCDGKYAVCSYRDRNVEGS